MAKYLVCFKASYSYGTNNFDEVVEWDGADVRALKAILRDVIRDKHCNGRKVTVCITILSVFELKEKSNEQN